MTALAANYRIFEAANGYTSNVLINEGLAPNVLVAHDHPKVVAQRPFHPVAEVGELLPGRRLGHDGPEPRERYCHCHP
jgi:hypothetical protein